MMNTVSCKTPARRRHRHATKSFSPVPHNIYEADNSFFIEFAIPGFAKEDFSLESTRTALKVTFTKPEKQGENSEQLNRGFHFDSFERSFKLNPQSLDFEGIHASYNQGILRVEVPKTEAAIQSSRSIPVL